MRELKEELERLETVLFVHALTKRIAKVIVDNRKVKKVEELNEGERAFINIIELALDMNLKVTKKDYEEYIRLIEKRKRLETRRKENSSV